jgi:hypothetical protein
MAHDKPASHPQQVRASNLHLIFSLQEFWHSVVSPGTSFGWQISELNLARQILQSSLMLEKIQVLVSISGTHLSCRGEQHAYLMGHRRPERASRG